MKPYDPEEIASLLERAEQRRADRAA